MSPYELKVRFVLFFVSFVGRCSSEMNPGSEYSRNPAIRSDHKVARGSKAKENHRKAKRNKGKQRKT